MRVEFIRALVNYKAGQRSGLIHATHAYSALLLPVSEACTKLEGSNSEKVRLDLPGETSSAFGQKE